MATLSIEQALQLAIAHQQAGRLVEAESIYRQILAQRPRHADALHLLGLIALVTGRHEQAIALILEAVGRRPAEAIYHANLGEAFRRMGRLDEAIASFQRSVALDPSRADTLSNLGNALMEMGRWDEAIACCHRAVAFDANYAEAHANLGAVHLRQGHLHEALAHCRRALDLRPDLGDAHWNLAIILLLLGHYEEGWREHEWRWLSPALALSPRKSPDKEWDGTKMPGETILLYAEQGFGDTIQFMRYVPLVGERAGAAQVVVECQPELVRLLSEAGGWNAGIVARQSGNESALPSFHRHLPLLSLPLTLGVLEPLPMVNPYLRACAQLRIVWHDQLAPAAGLRIGLVWAGNSQHRHDRPRSIESEKLLPILRLPEVTVYNLQIDPDSTQRAILLNAGMIDVTAHLTDFADTAALMAELDLIITVDTASAHLSGALGLRVWTLLPFVPDWRWGLEREDTPWYPTMRLFRQKTAGDWEEVVQRVVEELRALCSSRIP